MPDLSSERFEAIDQLFASALDQPDAERVAFVERASGGDAELRAEVLALLEADVAAADAFGESVSEYASPLLAAAALAPDDRDRVAPGERLGPYRLLEEIGRGGMGTVYLAERADAQFEKRVAIKLVRRGMDTEDVLRRFRYERQILASLEHPNIARLYDGGVSEDGRPYLVMEYVDGRPLAAYCDERRLDIDHRLALFRAACDAVQFAHQNLVVHRDIKPSNILVTAVGTIKLLDFGIAKLLEDDARLDAPKTRTELRVLTPEYASPEQQLGEPVTTASDVYALGVVLHELLTGRRPVSASGGSRALDAARETQPASRTAAAIEPATADARATSADRLVRRLRGDIDAIVAKALEPEPRRRYQSARELGEDIGRHLEGRPVTARRATAGYQAWRFVRRHRTGVTIALAFTALTVAFALFYSRRITRERDLANQQRRKAEHVVGFLTEMLAAANPNEAQGDTLTVYDVLARSEARLDTSLAGQPEVKEELLKVLGATYRELGDYARGRALLERAYRLGRSLRGDADTGVVNSSTELATVLQTTGELDSAERIVSHALAVRRATFGETSVAVAGTLGQLGEIRWGRGDYPGAVDAIRQAVAIQRRIGTDTAALAFLLNDLGAALRSLARNDSAEASLREAISLQRTALGPNHPVLAMSMLNLGALLRDRGSYAAAESLFRESLRIRRRALGPDHTDVANSLLGLAYTLEARKDYAAAESVFTEAIAINRRALGDRHPEVGMDLFALGVVVHERGDDVRAERLYRQAFDVMRNTLGPDHPNTTMAEVALGKLLVDHGRAHEAEPLLRQAVAARTETFGAGHAISLTASAELGWCLVREGRLTEAESLLVRSHERWPQPKSGRDSAAVRRLREHLVELYTRLGKPERAISYRTLLDSLGPAK